jgi:hypothetical protein
LPFPARTDCKSTDDADGVFLADSRDRCVCRNVVVDRPASLEKSPPQWSSLTTLVKITSNGVQAVPPGQPKDEVEKTYVLKRSPGELEAIKWMQFERLMTALGVSFS